MSKLQRLRDNIAAIEHALDGGHDRDILSKYSGFGGMNFILNDLARPWQKSDQMYVDDTVELHTLLLGHCKNEQEFDAWMKSLKASVLTAYYTPMEFVKALTEVIYGLPTPGGTDTYLTPKTMLDPAAGMGVFMDATSDSSGGNWYKVSMTAFEKDILTATMLKAKMNAKFVPNNGRAFVYCDGFEKFPADELGKFDLVATNVPFGDIAVFDPAYSNSKEAVRRDAAKMIHRYYVLKGLDCLRDGGIEAYIITSNYLNRDSEQLAEALKQARLIGAYRLANNLFRESGTEVGTDLLVLQKDSHKEGITAEESMLLTQYEDGGCPTNMYFDVYADHVIATDFGRDTDAYGKPAFIYKHEDGVSGISKQMAKVLAMDMQEHFDIALYERGAKKQKTEQQQKTQELTKPQMIMVAIYECYQQLYQYEAEKLEENVELRKELNKLYDDFFAEFGPLNYAPNKYSLKEIKSHGNISELLTLEYRSEKTGMWTKADIMLKPVAFSMDGLHEAGTPQEALAQSLNDYGYPDLQYMASMTGMSENDLVSALDGELYWDPLSEQYAIKAKFISGNVIEKIDAIRAKYHIQSNEMADSSNEMADPRVIHSLSALEAAVPTPIPFEDLDFNLGERWIGEDVYSSFGSEFFSLPEKPGMSSYFSGKVKMTVKYNPLLDQYAVSASGRNEKIWSQFSVSSEATKSLDGLELFIHALQNTCPKMMRYKRDADGRCMYNDKGEHIKEEDPEKTQLANAKIEEIRQGFLDWLHTQSKDFKERLADVYNRRFNCFVKPKYDGSHQTFPGLDMESLEKKYGIKHIYDSQKDCVWMLLQNQGGICDHEVGSGKTLIMCMAAHEMRRLGLCHKPMIIGLKANVSAIAETYQAAYPQCKILYASEADYSSSERVNFFNRMKNNDYDCVIMSHDQFSRIPQSEEIELLTLQEELSQVEDSIRACRGYDYHISARMMKGLERRKRNMEAKIQALQHTIRDRKDDVIDFAMMGIDHIFIDESHQFKNLGFVTRHDRVAGLGNSEGSQRAYNLLMAIRTIQHRTGRDLGATFLSGTTVTNSLTELYSLFRYLRPKALAKQGITCFDAWAAIFTKKSQEFEFSITNQIVLKERFRYFIKVPELAMFYNEITDFRTAEDVGIDRPQKHCMLLNIAPTPDQEEFIKVLMKFAKTGDFSLIGKFNVTDKQEKAKMLYATDMARKMSLDMRMIDESYGDHPRSKASRCATLVKRYYDQYQQQKGTQLIFSDLSTWQGANKGWNVYEEIKRKLVGMGIPSNEIRFIQECKCDSKKQALIKEVNEGKVRVLFGSTSMLGTGVNAQQRVVAVHHLDTPWRPSDLEQRDGRAIRKGNEIAKLYADNKVDIIIYAVERSLDSYKFNLLHCKQTFIQQLKRGQLSIRTLDEGAMDEDTGMNFSEYMAVLSGNTDLLTRAKIEKKIAGLESERKSFYRDKREQEERRDRMMKENEVLTKDIADCEKDYEKFTSAAQDDGHGGILNTLTLDGFTAPEDVAVGSDEWKKAVGERLIGISRSAHTSGVQVPVGSIYGFRVLVRTAKEYLGENDTMVYENVFSVEGCGRVKHTSGNGYLNHTSARISADNPLKALQNIPKRIAYWQSVITENEDRIAQLESILKTEWTKDDELKKLRTELGILDRKINEQLKNDEKSGGEQKPSGSGISSQAA